MTPRASDLLENAARAWLGVGGGVGPAEQAGASSSGCQAADRPTSQGTGSEAPAADGGAPAEPALGPL
eukprot:11174755-Lingulodinium_polyedra.AAC.1